MARLRMAVALLPALVVFVPPLPARAWGRGAHQVIANVAQARLSPAARREVAALLKSATLASIAGDADAWRNNHPETARWHYVNIPLHAENFDYVRDCRPSAEGDCIVAAINRLSDALRDRGKPEAERAQALAFLVHFVGDIHNPMHVVDDDDRGGNDTELVFYGRETNLHRVWDSGLFEQSGLTVTAWTLRLERLGIAADARGTPEGWAEETHREASRPAYELVAAGRSADIGRRYLDATRAILERQMLRAGVRLAALLNAVLGTR
ncbi:MAG: S1/P1 nuclease [Vicinamibacterales bacterium]